MSAAKLAEHPHSVRADAAQVARVVRMIGGIAELMIEGAIGNPEAAQYAAYAIHHLTNEAAAMADDVEAFVAGVTK